MPAGNYGEALLRVADQLCVALAHVSSGETTDACATLGERGTAETLGREDELLVSNLRRALAQIAVAVGAQTEEPATRPLQAALDGAELVTRGELMRGNPEQLPRLMPSFVFLVTLPVVGQDRALELSRQTTELIEAQLDS